MTQETSAQPARPPITQEYLVRQGGDEDLLITINAFEAELESRIDGQAGEMLLLSNVTDSRIMPVFQYVRASGEERQLNISVTSGKYTSRSEFGLELTRLTVWDDRSSKLSRAYGLLSFGMEAAAGSGGSNWTVKIDSLLNAGRIFQQFGMKEMRLWANYFAAHLVELHLRDHSIAYSMTRDILKDLRGSRLKKIELATLQLQGTALIGLKRASALQVSVENPDPVQAALSRVVALAEPMGFRFEQARALNASAMEYVADSSYEEALEQFEIAVKIADTVGETELATEIRESIVQVHTTQGNTPATGEVLREIETQLVEDGGGDELALNLLAQGRLLSRSYRYREAIGVLSEALIHQNNSAIRRQINFAMARAFYESGRFDDSLAYFRRAGVEAGDGGRRRANNMIDMGEGLQILANIHRAMADYSNMRRARKAQAGYEPEPATYLSEQGLDALAEAGGNSRTARSAFMQSHAAAVRSGHVDMQHLSRLRACAQGRAGDDLCTMAAIRASYDWLSRAGVPKFSVEAMWLWAQILDSSGQPSSAVEIVDKLLKELHFLRHSLPGVLGSWYRENSSTLLDYSLDLQLRASDERNGADASASLLTLTRLRNIENYSDFRLSPGDSPAANEVLRLQLSQRARSASGPVSRDLVRNINRDLEHNRQLFSREFAYLSQAGLRTHLQSLASDERLLTFHVSPTTAQVWVGLEGRVERRAIKNPAAVYGGLQEAGQGLADAGISSFNEHMATLGEQLIGPVEDLLARTIYWIPSGVTLGLPLDALSVRGKPLLEDHSVINLLSFPARPGPAASLKSRPLESVFVAGYPQEYSGAYPTRLNTSKEISAVADIFVGPGLHIIQGGALLPDEFQDERFERADLLHLSMPGVIDLKYPEQSRLELSGAEYSPAGVLLTPADFFAKRLNASLVFLSRTRLEGKPMSDFGSAPGLVVELLDAGAQSVIINTWGTDGDAAQSLITDFYRRLQSSGNISNALRAARRQYIENNRDTGLHDWAGYQLFVK